MKYALDFIEIVERPDKPRSCGLTLVRDPGYGLKMIEAYLETGGAWIDYVKFRNYNPRFYSEKLFYDQIKLYRDYDVKPMVGGTTGEICYLQGHWDRMVDYLHEAGCQALEISTNYLEISEAEKLKLVHQCAEKGFDVLLEWGVKTPTEPLDPDKATKDIKALLDEGARMVILEEGEVDLLLGKDGKSPNAQRMHDLIEGVGIENIIIESVERKQQTWLLLNYGPTINIGPNVLFEDVFWLENMRRGLGRPVDFQAIKDWLPQNRAKKGK
ncbi:MAG: phosphosulfolactate synthase [Rhodospirillales bacterium]